MLTSSDILASAGRSATQVILFIWLASFAHAEERPHSRLVVPGPNGKLTYSEYSDRGDRLPDFSWCGYRGGGIALPKLPVKLTLEAVAGDDDDQAQIQKALDTVGEMPLDEKGFRGAVLLKRGTYRVGGTLNLNKSGVVLRGEGDDENGTVIIASARKKYTVIQISGSGSLKEVEDTKQEILAEYVPVGSRTFKVKDASAYKVGDEVLVCRESNQDWIDAIDMKGVNWKPFTMKFQRVVLAVTKDSVTVDAPLVNPIAREWGGGYLMRSEFPERVENIGIEGIRCDSVYASPTDHAHAWQFVSIRNAQNIWMRDCTALHFAYTAVEINASAKMVTVQDTKCLDMISEIKGGLRYPFAIIGQLNLVQRCFAREARHDFVMQYWVPGPNVFLDCRSENPLAESGCHQRYATGTLYDNVETGRLSVVNRGDSGSGHGWAGAQNDLWNCKADSINVQQPPTAQNFAIGCVADKKMGNGYWESKNIPVSPRSLYLQQLEERLGPEAVKSIQR